eukprot:2678753-Pyramimonas_sp.AAC.1
MPFGGGVGRTEKKNGGTRGQGEPCFGYPHVARRWCRPWSSGVCDFLGVPMSIGGVFGHGRAGQVLPKRTKQTA